jgi:putative hydrolase of the HAD superfamily
MSIILSKEQLKPKAVKGVKWIFFDVGSTLTDEAVFERFMFREVYRFLIRSGVQLTRRRFDRAVHKSIRQEKYRWRPGTGWSAYRRLLAGVIADLGFEDKLPQVLNFCGRNLFPYYLNKVRVNSEARATLKTLKKKYHLGIIGNQPAGFRDLLEKFGLAKYFRVVVLSEEVGACKPSRQIFNAALKAAGCQPRQALMIGDRRDCDVAPAKKVGMKTILLKRGMSATQKPVNLDEVADCELDHLKNVLRVL